MLRVAAAVWANIHCNSIDVAKEMVVAVEPGDLFGCPNRKHLRVLAKDLLNAVPVNLQSHSHGSITSPVCHPSFLIGARNFAAVQQQPDPHQAKLDR